MTCLSKSMALAVAVTIAILSCCFGQACAVEDPNSWSEEAIAQISLLEAYMNASGIYYREWATTSHDEHPIDVQIVRTGVFSAKIYGPSLGGQKGATFRIRPANRVRINLPGGSVLTGKISDHSTIALNDGRRIRRWLVPTNWYGRSGAAVSIRSGNIVFLDVVESNKRRWKLVPNLGTQNFRVEGPDAPSGSSHNWWTRSINFSNGGDQWTPFVPAGVPSGEFRGPL